jgi:hypothetical protein
MTTRHEQKYLAILTEALSVCGDYRPKFGQGGQAGLTLEDFQRLYEADQFYSWFGLSSPLMYAAHKAAGGMTSLYRQIGMGCQRLFVEIPKDHLRLNEEQASWFYTISEPNKTQRRLSLDARISLDAIADPQAKKRIDRWISAAAGTLQLPRSGGHGLKGAVFEVRQGYKSKDSKRQNADVANAANAYAHRYLPVVLLLSSQIDGGVAERYARARWLLLTGVTAGTPLVSAYVFLDKVVGYDLAGFLRQNSNALKTQIESLLEKLLYAK